MKRIINFRLTESSNFIFHVLAFFNFEKEWGPANLFNQQYLKTTRHKIVASSDIKNILAKVYGPISFWGLNVKYDTVPLLLSDLKDSDEINNLLSFFKEPRINNCEKEKLYNFLSDEYNNFYKDYWTNNVKKYVKLLGMVKKNSNKIIGTYLDFLDKINPDHIFPKNVIIYLVESLDKKGRGLFFGCAIGLPHNRIELKNNLATGLHEMTHPYSDDLLANLGYKIDVRPTDKINHNRKEQTVDYILKYYLTHCSNKMGIEIEHDVHKKFIPQEIKKTLEKIKPS